MVPALKILKILKTIKTLKKYVEEPNELDYKVSELEKEIEKLKKDSHPPVFKTEERDAIMARIISHSDRLIKLEKKTKKLKWVKN